MRGLALCLVAAVACGQVPGEEHLLNWSRPPAGERIRAVATVQDRFGFEIVTPHGLHGLRSLFATTSTEATDAIWFVYQDPTFGRLWVVESSPPDIPNARERLDAYHDIEHAEVFLVRGGTPMLVGTRSTAGGEFVQGEVQFTITGPHLSHDDVVRIANLI